MTTTRTLLVACVAAVVSSGITYAYLNREQTTENNENSICMNYPNAKPSMLTTGLVRAMVSKYDVTQYQSIIGSNRNPVPADAKAIWFDLETLKEFIYHIEANAGKVAEEKNQTLGIRIYYCAYPEKEILEELNGFQSDPDAAANTAYENLHTLVMIPTISSKDGNMDFNPFDAKTYDGFVKMDLNSKYSYLDNDYSLLGIGPQNDPTNTNNTTNMAARNHGTLYPPGNPSGFAFGF